MYRGYEADWTTPRPRPQAPPRPVFRPPMPAETLPPPDPGALPDYQRRFPIRPLGPAPQPPTLPQPVPRPPPRRPPVAPWLRRVMFAHELLSQLNPPPGVFPQTFLSGGWFRICGPVPPAAGYTQSATNWRWDAAQAVPPGFCGLAGQAISGIDDAPLITDKQFRTFYKLIHPTLNRYQVNETWTRADASTLPQPQWQIKDPFWPVIDTWPATPVLPAVEGVNPHAWPWAVIPYLANTGWPEASVRSNGDPQAEQTPAPNTSTTVQVVVSPGVGPQVETATGPYIRDYHKSGTKLNIRERKVGLKSWMLPFFALRDMTTEGVDLIDAFWKALPWTEAKRQFMREHTGHGALRYNYQRTLYIWRHYREIDLDKLIANIISNHIEDMAYGYYFKQRQRAYLRYNYWEHN